MKIFLFLILLETILTDMAMRVYSENKIIPKGDSLNEIIQILDEDRDQTQFNYKEPVVIDQDILTKMFKDIDESACNYIDEKQKETCEKNLQLSGTEIVGNNTKNENDFLKDVEEHIFKPLAIQIQLQSGYQQFFTNMAKGQYEKSSLLENQPLMTDYKSFQESIQNTFDDIIGKTSDIDAFQEPISELVISLLKKFHIYWNSLRQNDQIPQTIEDTKNIMKFMVDQYLKKNQFLQNIIQVFFSHMKAQYSRFLKAHYMFNYLKKQLPSKIIEVMVQRFENGCNEITYDRINYIKILIEYDAQLDMQASLMISLYRHQYTEDQIKTVLQTQIETRYIQILNAYRAHLATDKPTTLKKITDFTAVILLKMKYRIFIFQYVHNLAEVVNSPNVNNYSEHKTSVRVYHELKDTMMLIPRKCSEYLKLKPCFLFYTNEAIRYLASKYQLKRSIGGIGVFGYLHDIFIEFYSKPTKLDWNNFTLIKEFFYQNLFSVLQNYKNNFLVKSESSLNQLETIIGKIINQQRVDVNIENINQGLLDQFDQDVYEKFLQLKADYNIKSPISRDPSIMTDIVNQILTFLKEFHEKYIKEMNDSFRNLIIQIANSSRSWKDDNLKKDKQVIQIQELPLNQNNDYPQVFHYVKNNNNSDLQSQNQYKPFDFENEMNDVNTHSVEFEQLPVFNSYNNSIVDSIDNSKENGIVGDASGFSPSQ